MADFHKRAIFIPQSGQQGEYEQQSVLWARRRRGGESSSAGGALLQKYSSERHWCKQRSGKPGWWERDTREAGHARGGCNGTTPCTGKCLMKPHTEACGGHSEWWRRDRRRALRSLRTAYCAEVAGMQGTPSGATLTPAPALACRPTVVAECKVGTAAAAAELSSFVEKVRHV